MRQFSYIKSRRNKSNHCWAFLDGVKYGYGTFDSNTKADKLTWGIKDAEHYVKQGIFEELQPNEFMYLDRFNKAFGIVEKGPETQSYQSGESDQPSLCTCDFTVILQKGCQCGGN